VFDLEESENAKVITEISRNLALQINLRNLNAGPDIEILLGDEE